MRRFVIFFLLFSFVITGSNYSMQMFSLEQGSVHTENYDLYHVLSNLPADICTTCERHKNSLTSRKDKHAHVILFNSIANSERDISINPINLLLIDFTFPSQRHPRTLKPANTLQNKSVLKLLSSILPPPLLITKVLLV
jgi:hypothetical protein